MMACRQTINWGYHSGGTNQTWFCASLLSRDGCRVIWTTGATTNRPALCAPHSLRDVMRVLRERLGSLRPGRKLLITRNIHY